MDAYNRGKESNPEFYREGSSFQYGKVEEQEEYVRDVAWRVAWLPDQAGHDFFKAVLGLFDDLRSFSGVSVPDKITIVRVIYPLCAKLIHC